MLLEEFGKVAAVGELWREQTEDHKLQYYRRVYQEVAELSGQIKGILFWCGCVLCFVFYERKRGRDGERKRGRWREKERERERESEKEGNQKFKKIEKKLIFFFFFFFQKKKKIPGAGAR